MAIHVSQSVTIARAPKDVSNFMIDMRNEPKYWEGVKSVTLLEGKPGAAGSKFERVFDAMGREQKTNLTITEYKPGEIGRSQSDPGMVTVQGTTLFETVPEGTKLTLTIDATVKGFGKLFSGKIKKTMEENTRTSLDRLKQILESEKPAKAAPAAKPAKAPVAKSTTKPKK